MTNLKPAHLQHYSTRFDGYWIVQRVTVDFLDPELWNVELVRRQHFGTPQAVAFRFDADEFYLWALKTGAQLVVPAPQRFVGELPI